MSPQDPTTRPASAKAKRGTARAVPRLALGYVRVSTTGQVESGAGLAAQRKAIEQHCEREGLKLVRIHSEEGVSGSVPLGDRPEGQVALSWLHDNASERPVLVVARLDRAFRSAADLLTQVDTLRKAKIALHLVDLGIKAEPGSRGMRSVVDRLFLTLLGAVSEMERELIRERTKASVQARIQAGYAWGRTPYGFMVHPAGRASGFVPYEPEQRVLGWIVSMRENGQTLGKIAHELWKAQVLTPRGEVGWDRAGVLQQLRRLTPETTRAQGLRDMALAAYRRFQQEREAGVRAAWEKADTKKRAARTRAKAIALREREEAIEVLRRVQGVLREEDS